MLSMIVEWVQPGARGQKVGGVCQEILRFHW